MSAESGEVTVVNGRAWADKSTHIAQHLRQASPGAVIPDPGGQPPNPEHLAVVTDPNFWSSQSDALAEALAAGTGASPGRLTLTVQEAATVLGISRAFPYEAVRRGETPSIRIGRRVLVPRVALDRLVGPTETEPVIPAEDG
jgi:excisionase family DNA binding protein